MKLIIFNFKKKKKIKVKFGQWQKIKGVLNTQKLKAWMGPSGTAKLIKKWYVITSMKGENVSS